MDKYRLEILRSILEILPPNLQLQLVRDQDAPDLSLELRHTGGEHSLEQHIRLIHDCCTASKIAIAVETGNQQGM